MNQYQIITKSFVSKLQIELDKILIVDDPLKKFKGQSVKFLFDFLDLNYPEYTVEPTSFELETIE